MSVRLGAGVRIWNAFRSRYDADSYRFPDRQSLYSSLLDVPSYPSSRSVPNEFYARGGGNCVDYSLATTAFLGYHGIESYIGGFFAPGEPVGHPLVLVPVEAVPAGYTYICASR